MVPIIGQQKILKVIDKLVEANSIPQFIIIEGSVGGGKKLIAQYIANKLKATIIRVESLKIADIRDILEDSRNISDNKVYLIPDSDTITNQAENALLKLAEEPPKYGYIVMTIEDRNTILPTILSRATIYKLEDYTREQLKQFTENEIKLDVCNTPGQVIDIEDYEIEDTYKFTEKVVTNIDKISILNLFNIPKYIDLNKKGDGYNLNIFLNMFSYILYDEMHHSTDINLFYSRMKVIAKYKRLFVNKSINKQMCFDNMLLELRSIQ